MNIQTVQYPERIERFSLFVRRLTGDTGKGKK